MASNSDDLDFHRQTPYYYQPQYSLNTTPAYNLPLRPSDLPHHQPRYLPPAYSRPLVMAGQTSNELEAFQRLSDQYQPDLPGPLIGNKLPMIKLVEEYTMADPTYVAKTQAMAASYSGYRRVKGDGQCGWRGTVFGYFETLLKLGDVQLVMQEQVRLQSFADTMRMAGIDYDIIVDMFDYTWELFAELIKAVERHDASDSVVLDWLNDENKSNSIVYHFKMMTSAFLQMNPDNYEPFLEMPVADYRVARIDPANQEIDQVGLQILTDAIIAQAGFALSVLYLDRSYGDEVTPHEFAPQIQGGPIIRLLYRPGHYDIIYQDDRGVRVFMQTESLVSVGMEMAYASDLSSDMQAYLFAGPQTTKHTTPSYPNYDIGPSDTSQQHSLAYHDSSYTIQPHFQYDNPPPPIAITYQAPLAMNMPMSATPPISPSPHPAILSLPHLTSPPSFRPKLEEPKIRMSLMSRDYELKHESVPLCSQKFGSVVSASPAHFQNQDFQPQIWNANEDYY